MDWPRRQRDAVSGAPFLQPWAGAWELVGRNVHRRSASAPAFSSPIGRVAEAFLAGDDGLDRLAIDLPGGGDSAA